MATTFASEAELERFRGENADGSGWNVTPEYPIVREPTRYLAYFSTVFGIDAQYQGQVPKMFVVRPHALTADEDTFCNARNLPQPPPGGGDPREPTEQETMRYQACRVMSMMATYGPEPNSPPSLYSHVGLLGEMNPELQKVLDALPPAPAKDAS